MFTFSKLVIYKTADEAFINFSQLFNNQYVLYSLKDSEKAEIFLTWWNETSYIIIFKKNDDFSDFSSVWENLINFKNATNSI